MRVKRLLRVKESIVNMGRLNDFNGATHTGSKGRWGRDTHQERKGEDRRGCSILRKGEGEEQRLAR